MRKKPRKNEKLHLQNCPQGASVITTRASDIRPAKIAWLWAGIIASGRVTGLVGHPGIGKSQVSTDLAATVSTGRGWPGGASNAGPGEVILLAAEDNAADTLVPRLMAAGAALERIHIVKAVRDIDGFERAFNVAVDFDRLEKAHDLRDVRLLIIDPASAYLGSRNGIGIDRNNGGDVRAFQTRLSEFAAKHELAILAISHLNKTNGAGAITRIMGSLEWVAAPRAVFLVTQEADTDRCFFLPLKNNLAPDRSGYAFRIKTKIVGDGIETSAVEWEPKPVTITPEEALAAIRKPTSDAMVFLKQVLSHGAMAQSDIVRRGKEAGFSEKALRTAREALRVKPHKVGFGRHSQWVWPETGATSLKLVVDNNPKLPGGDANIPSGDKGAAPQDDPAPGDHPDNQDELKGDDGGS